jgi:TonB family protein
MVLAALFASLAFASSTTLANEADSNRLKVGAPAVAEEFSCTGLIVQRGDLAYPRQAIASRLEGWVHIKHQVTADGTVENLVVLGEQPVGAFTEAAKAAVMGTKFKPGSTVRECQSVLTFTLSDG